MPESTITESSEEGVVVLTLGASSCHMEAFGVGLVLTFHKGTVELPHLRIEGLSEEEARGRARRWLLAEHAASSAFTDRREARIEGLLDAAETRRAGAEAASDRAHAIGERFAGGQPIILRHHSTERALADRAKMDGAMRKSLALNGEADELVMRARAAAGNTAVSSDDPDGIAKLCDRLAGELEDHDLMRRVRKATAKGEKAGDSKAVAAALRDPALGLTDAQMHRFAREPVEAWMLANSNGRIKGTRARIEALLALAARVPPPPEEINGAEISEEENRVRIRFPRRASDAVCAFLERNAFHWSGSNRAWQRMPGPHPGVVWELARDAARMTAEPDQAAG